MTVTHDEQGEPTGAERPLKEILGTEEDAARRADLRPDPLNAAIAATAGEVHGEAVSPLKDILGSPEDAERRADIPPRELQIHPMETLPTPEQHAAAMQAYIDEGVRHATGHFGSAEVVSVSAFREAIGKLLEHLHLDHPENYLPK